MEEKAGDKVHDNVWTGRRKDRSGKRRQKHLSPRSLTLREKVL